MSCVNDMRTPRYAVAHTPHNLYSLCPWRELLLVWDRSASTTARRDHARCL